MVHNLNKIYNINFIKNWKNKKQMKYLPLFLFASTLMLSACTPTIQLDTPKEGITINMNVVVDHNISVKMDEKTQQTVGSKKDKKKK